MKRWGCLGLLGGSLIGLLLALVFFAGLRLAAAPAAVVQPVPTAGADVELFVSEHLLSRYATESSGVPTVLDFDDGGALDVVTRTRWGPFNPVIQLGMSLEMRGRAVDSQLNWVKIGFLEIPAGGLPQNIVDLGVLPGETITQQVPPDFELVGLRTTADGVEFQLNWKGRLE